VEGIRKRGRPRKRRRDEIERDLNITEVKKQAGVQRPSGMAKIVLQAKVHNKLYRMKRKRKRRRRRRGKKEAVQ
jgi:hypothetical protein